MKKVIAILALMASATAFAQTSTANTTVETNSQAISGSSNDGNSQTIVFEAQDNTEATREAGAADISVALINAAAARDIAGTTAVIRNTPSVNGSPLVSSNDTCMGSASGAVNGPGFGVALGKTYTDDNCVMLKNSRELWNMGMKAASLALMCNDSKNKEALELTGFECPQTTKAKQAAAPQASATPAVSVNGYTGNDQIVIDRMASK